MREIGEACQIVCLVIFSRVWLEGLNFLVVEVTMPSNFFSVSSGVNKRQS